MAIRLSHTTKTRRQTDSWSCGAVTAAVCLDVVGVDPSISSVMVANQLAITRLDGVDPRSLEAFFRSNGYSVQSGEMTVDDLKYHTEKLRPVACLITYDEVGHWVTVFACSSRFVSYHCPILGVIKKSIKQFKSVWHDYDRSGLNYDGFGVVLLANNQGE